MLAVATPETPWWTSDVGNSYHVADDGELVVDTSTTDEGPGQFLSEDFPHPENPSVKVTIAYGFGTAHQIIVTNGETRDIAMLIADSKMRFEWSGGEFCIYSTSAIIGLPMDRTVGGIRVNSLREPIIEAPEPWCDNDSDGDRYDTAFGMLFIIGEYLSAIGSEGARSLGKIPYEGRWRIAGEQTMNTIVIQRRPVGDLPAAYTTYNIIDAKWGPMIAGDVPSGVQPITSQLTEDSVENVLMSKHKGLHHTLSKADLEAREKFRNIIDKADVAIDCYAAAPVMSAASAVTPAASAASTASAADGTTYDLSSHGTFKIGDVIPLDMIKSHNDWVSEVTVSKMGQTFAMPEHVSCQLVASAAASATDATADVVIESASPETPRRSHGFSNFS